MIITSEAFNKLSYSVLAAKCRYEVGGVLLGHRFFQIFYVIDLTVSGNLEKGTRVSFRLDGNEHTEEMIEIMQSYKHPPVLIGVWHSHTLGINSFSAQDIESNRLLVSQIGEMLSIIAMQSKDTNCIELTSYYITKNNKESMCRVNIDTGSIWMPRKFMQRRV